MQERMRESQRKGGGKVVIGYEEIEAEKN